MAICRHRSNFKGTKKDYFIFLNVLLLKTKFLVMGKFNSHMVLQKQ